MKTYQEKWSGKGLTNKKIVQKYEYKDEKDKLLFECIRFEPKAFRQRRLDGKGGYIWNLKGIRRVLYRLPELIAGKGPVFICEGEKDVDNLRLLRLTATCCPMGASKWKKEEREYNPFLKRRSVIIIPDNDWLDVERKALKKEHLAGEKHLIQVATSLKGIASSTRVLRLPEASDFSDWKEKDKNNTEEKFLMLISDAVKWEEIEEETKKNVEKLEKEIKEREREEKKKVLPPPVKEKQKIKTLIPGLIHLVNDQGRIKYLLKKQGRLVVEENYDFHGEVYIPKQDLPLKLPTLSILKQSLKIKYSDLLDEIENFIKDYLEMPNESDYLILALWLFHTYLMEKFDTTPILYFYGVKETGKTRAGEVLMELAFRCERLTSPTEATLFRSAHYFKTTLVIDEIKLWGLEGNQEVARLIKSRYKRGLMVSRVNLNKQGEDQIEYFDVFAPLVICTTESIPDTIESRCIVFLMQKNLKIGVEKEIDQDRADKLRNKLTIFRADYLEQELSRAEQIARGRLNEIMIPLYRTLMLVDPEKKEAFKMIVEEMGISKEEEESLSLEAEIVKAIRDSMQPEFLTLELRDKLNEDRSERERLSSTLISIRTKRLGFKKIRMQNGKMGFKTNPKLLKNLISQFGI